METLIDNSDVLRRRSTLIIRTQIRRLIPWLSIFHRGLLLQVLGTCTRGSIMHIIQNETVLAEHILIGQRWVEGHLLLVLLLMHRSLLISTSKL